MQCAVLVGEENSSCLPSSHPMDFEDIPAPVEEQSTQPEFGFEDPSANETSSDAFATYGGSQDPSVEDSDLNAGASSAASNDAFAAIAEPEDELT